MQLFDVASRVALERLSEITPGTPAYHLARQWRRWRLNRRSGVGAELSAFEKSVGRKLWLQAADSLGLETAEVPPALKIGIDRQDPLYVYGSVISSESAVAYRITGEKVTTNEWLTNAGIKVPEGRAFTSRELHAAKNFISGALGGRCVVKPANGTSSGRGVTVLPDQGKLAQAFYDASSYSDLVLVEEFVTGTNFRALVHRGKCLSIVSRDLPSVVGDGSRTVRQLVERENETRVRDWKWTERLLMPIRIDADTEALLKAQGFEWTSVPPRDHAVTLSSVCNYQHGSSYREVLGVTHPDIVSAVERAATTMLVTLAGVDIITPDITSSTYFVNEVNTSPLLLIHYAPDHGRRDPISLLLADHFGLNRPL